MHILSSIAHSIKELLLFIGKHVENIIFTSILYLLIAGAFYLFFYVWKSKKYWHLKIQQRSPEAKHIVRDIKYSLSTTVIFGLVSIWVFYWARKHGYTQVYTPIDKYGYAWYFISMVLMVIVHDAYFYWTHRLLHWKPLFKIAHKTHHLTHDPTPFSAYAFHPLEAIVNVGIVPLIAFLIPAHISAITIYLIYNLILNVFGHLGFEFVPKKIAHHKLTKWHNTFTHHNMHHQFIKCNYGIYFNFCDWIMKTNHPHYVDHFDKVVERKEQSEIVVSGETKSKT